MIFCICGNSVTLADKKPLVTLERYSFKELAAFLLPIRFQNLTILKCSLLDFDVCMIEISFHQFFDFLVDPWQSDRQFRQRSQSPADHSVRAFSFAIILIQHINKRVNNLIGLHLDDLSSLISGLPINKHLAILTDEPAAELGHSDLVDVVAHRVEHFGHDS